VAHPLQEHSYSCLCQVVEALLVNRLEDPSQAEVRARLKLLLELFKVQMQLNFPKLKIEA